MSKFLSALLFLSVSCSTGHLTVIADLPNILNEVSGTETISDSNLIWMINDSGNASLLYGLNTNGKIEKEIKINHENKDWEDLTSDDNGNLYIGDFGNNSKKRKTFYLLKLPVLDKTKEPIKPEIISFKLPKHMKSKDFEAFFLYKDHFYIFSKEPKKFKILKVPNTKGDHIAKVVDEYSFEGKKTQITGADISKDGKTVVLLNHNRVWKLSNFTSDHFFSGDITSIPFKHTSQKEGICFKNNNTLYITDERTKHDGGHLYEFLF